MKLWENALNSSISGCSRSSSSTGKQCFRASNALLEFVEKERASIIGDVVIAALGLEVKVTDAVIVIGHEFDCTRTNSFILKYCLSICWQMILSCIQKFHHLCKNMLRIKWHVS